MKIYNTVDLMREHARATNKFCMYISWVGQNDPTELVKAAPYMKDEEDMLYALSKAVLIFDTEEEMYRYYDMTVGDDGPTEYNDYSGPARVYAITCNNNGELETENT